MRAELMLIAVLASLALHPQVARGAQPSEPRKEPVLAVMDIINNTGEFAAFVDGMPDMLITELMETGEIRLVERTKVQTAMKALKLEASGLTEERNLELGKWLGVDGIVFGAFNKVGEKYRLDMRAIDVQTGKIKVAASATCGKHDVLEIIPEIGRQLRARLAQASAGLPPSPAPAAQPVPAAPAVDSCPMVVEYKMMPSLLSQGSIPHQKVRVYLDNRLIGVSPVVDGINRYYPVFQGKVPVGEHTLVLLHGSVDGRGRWIRELDQQPERLQVMVRAGDRVGVQYKMHAHDDWFSFKDFKVNFHHFQGGD